MVTTLKRSSFRVLVLFPIVICIGLSSLAQKPQILPPRTKAQAAPAIAQAPSPTPQLTREDVEAFLDGLLPIQLQRDDIAGAVVMIVKDGKVLFAKGYGYAEVGTKKPVTVDATLFRPGSISKTFTWTAVMQLVEQGKLDLNRDVNDYLDFKIPATFGKPLTLKDIMTHTPGFEETLKDLFVADASRMRPLDQYMKTHLPEEIFPPGTTPAYSNYGASLAGYIVQRVSGLPFDDYVEQNILKPLGMRHSTFRQPLPGNLKPLMSEGYDKASQVPKSFEFVQAWPAGSMSVSADDMSHWMMAHLQNGEYNGAHVLKPETAQLMHSRVFGLVPSLNGMAYGFYEESRNGHRIIGHGGDTQWFHSDMHLMLDDRIGFFLSYNSAGKGGYSPRSALWQTFLDRYFPYTPPAGEQVANAAQDAKSVTGGYWSSRRSATNIAAVLSAIDQNKVTTNSDGTISLDAAKDFAGNPKHFKEIAPLLFRDVNGQSHLAFIKDYAGRQIIVTDVPIAVDQPVPALKSQILNLSLVVSAIVVFVLTLLFWPVNAMLRSHYQYRTDLSPQYLRGRMMMRLFSILNVAFVGSFGAWGLSVDDNIGLISSQFDLRLHLLQVLGVLGAIGAVFSVVYCVRTWKDDSLWFWAKLWNTLLMMACVSYAFFLWNWHLLNFNLSY